ncbi:PIN-like domain-containing protein [Bacillus sp. FSL R5-0654]|uniref:PIN-like domain-containing protein n=1 Tax=Bacillus sp. FSL R5-0654 TaxID=2954589 RepID=UPI0030F7737B
MREQFREFYFDKDDKDIWKNSIIVLDTNVLLNLYRYTQETSEQILNLLQKYKKNLWMPHQVALEYHYNRKSVIVEQSGSYEKVCDAFGDVPNKIRNMLNQDLSNFKKRHKEDVESFFEIIKNVTDEQIKQLRNKNEIELDLTKEDTIKSKITELYENKVGKPYDYSKMKELEKEAEERFKKDIPPGYKDLNKKTGTKFYNGVVIQNRYGDLILWKQILNFALEREVNIIFLTDEQKEDWWYDINNKIIGPRVELLNEFTYVTNKEFHMFSSIGFVERHEEDVNQNTVSEVREVNEVYEINKIKKLKTKHKLNIYKDGLKNLRLTKAGFSYENINFNFKNVILFCEWFKENESLFPEEYKTYEFVKLLIDEFNSDFAEEILGLLLKENLEVWNEDKKTTYIKMDILKSKVHLTLLDIYSKRSNF